MYLKVRSSRKFGSTWEKTRSIGEGSVEIYLEVPVEVLENTLEKQIWKSRVSRRGDLSPYRGWMLDQECCSKSQQTKIF